MFEKKRFVGNIEIDRLLIAKSRHNSFLFLSVLLFPSIANQEMLSEFLWLLLSLFKSQYKYSEQYKSADVAEFDKLLFIDKITNFNVKFYDNFFDLIFIEHRIYY